jgi:hypothetical protein
MQASPKLLEQSEHVCFDLVQAEIDLAFSLLRLAETANRRGRCTDALELIAKASRICKSALRYPSTLTQEFEKDRMRLRASADALFDAIHETALFVTEGVPAGNVRRHSWDS